ncbi:MAG: hypothetical protein R2867_18650 [Caldilineaceae bacterium]
MPTTFTGVSAMTFLACPPLMTPGEPTVAFLWDELDRATRKAVERLRSKFDRCDPCALCK